MQTRHDELRLAVSDTLQALDGVIKESSSLVWSPTNGIFPLIRSGILRRQYECLSVAVDLVDKSQGFAAVTLLRAACEEMIWAKYLAAIDRKDAEQLLQLIGNKEITDSLKAQDDHAGRKTSDILGLTKYLKNMEASAANRKTQIQSLGKKLRWDKRTIDLGNLPSMSFLAKTVGETKLYKLLYHASSRYVHFSVGELLRRSWGQTGKVTVSSAHFADYWGDFVMYWGVYLLISTFPVLLELGEETEMSTFDSELLLNAAKRIAAHGPVPIITSGELEWGP